MNQFDTITTQGIRSFLQPACAGLTIEVIPMAGSTNALVREKAAAGVPEGYVLFANEQSSGRGRLGHSFFSPPGTGIYMSILLRPTQYSSGQAIHITTLAAVAMCEAIEAVSEETAQIKWVNDIFIRGKKVCGILTEASFQPESGLIEYAVLGVGINAFVPDGGFPSELEAIVGSVFSIPREGVKNQLAAEFLNRFFASYQSLGNADYTEKYRRRSLAIGRKVRVISAAQTRNAFVLGMDDDCRLHVRYEDGTEGYVSSGEISIRL